MKAVILAGGPTMRLAGDFLSIPKPMVEIGSHPILWHIMKIYSHYGVNEFIVCLGNKGYEIKEYFLNYSLHNSDVTFDYSENKVNILKNYSEPWKISLIDTGIETETGGRLKKIKDYLPDETFCFTYGDIVADIDIDKLIKFHNEEKKSGSIATMTAVSPKGRRGTISFEGDKVSYFDILRRSEGWINGGFYVLEPSALDYIKDDFSSWELDCLSAIQKKGKLSAYKHDGFWWQLDNLRDKNHLDALINSDEAPWKTW